MSRETTADTGDEYDEETHVERTDVGVSITSKIQRGTGTNDRDTVELKVKKETRQEAVAELRSIEPAAKAHLAEVRGWQPDQEDDA
jgi:hypothetical protein